MIEPVFPTLVKDGEAAVVTGGISLRDFFAAVVMHAIVVNGKYNHGTGRCSDVACLAYSMSEAMMSYANSKGGEK